MFKGSLKRPIRLGLILLSILWSAVSAAAPDGPIPVETAVPFMDEHTDNVGWSLIRMAFENPEIGVLNLEEVAIRGISIPNPDPEKNTNFQGDIDRHFMYYYDFDLHRLSTILSRDWQTGQFSLTASKGERESTWLPYQFKAIAIAHGITEQEAPIRYVSARDAHEVQIANHTIEWIESKYQVAMAEWARTHRSTSQGIAEIPRLIEMLLNPPPQWNRPRADRPITLREAESIARMQIISSTGIDPLAPMSRASDASAFEMAVARYRRLVPALMEIETRREPRQQVSSFDDILNYVRLRLVRIANESLQEYLRQFPEGSLTDGAGQPINIQDYRLEYDPEYRDLRFGKNGDFQSYLTIQHIDQEGRKHFIGFRNGLDITVSNETRLMSAIFDDRLLTAASYTALNHKISEVLKKISDLTERDVREAGSYKRADLVRMRSSMLRLPRGLSEFEIGAFSYWFKPLFEGNRYHMLRFGLMTLLSFDENFLDRQNLAQRRVDFLNLFKSGFQHIVIPNLERFRSSGSFMGYQRLEQERNDFYKAAWRDYVRRLQGLPARGTRGPVYQIPSALPPLRTSMGGSARSDLMSNIGAGRVRLGSQFEGTQGAESARDSHVVLRLSSAIDRALYFYKPVSNQSFIGWTPAARSARLGQFIFQMEEPQSVRSGMFDLMIPVGYEAVEVHLTQANGQVIDRSTYSIEKGQQDAGLRVRFHQSSSAPDALTYSVSATEIDPSRLSRLTFTPRTSRIESLIQQAEEAGLTNLARDLRNSPPRSGADLVDLVHRSALYTKDSAQLQDIVVRSLPESNVFAPFAPYIRSPYLLGVCGDHNLLLEVLARALEVDSSFLPTRGMILMSPGEKEIFSTDVAHDARLFRLPGQEVSVLDGTSPHAINPTTNQVGLRSSFGSALANFGEWFMKLFQWGRSNGENVEAIRHLVPEAIANESLQTTSDELPNQRPILQSGHAAVVGPRTDLLDANNPRFVEFVNQVHVAWERMWEFQIRMHPAMQQIADSDGPTRALMRLSTILKYLSGDAAYSSAFRDVARNFRLDHTSATFWTDLQRIVDSVGTQLRFIHDNFEDPRQRIQERFPYLSLGEVEQEQVYFESLRRVLANPMLHQHATELPSAIAIFRPMANSCQYQFLNQRHRLSIGQ